MEQCVRAGPKRTRYGVGMNQIKTMMNLSLCTRHWSPHISSRQDQTRETK